MIELVADYLICLKAKKREPWVNRFSFTMSISKSIRNVLCHLVNGS